MNSKKALWIAEKLELDADDTFDMITGNITSPSDIVLQVQQLSEEYDEMKKHIL